MAKKKDKTIIWILLLGGAGAAYWYLTSQKAAAAPATTTAIAPPTIVPALPPAGPVAQIPAPNLQVAPPTLSVAPALYSPTVSTAPSMPNTAQLQTLQQWAQSSLTPCDLARWNNMQSGFTADASAYGYPSEWAGLVDIYFNDWVGGEGNNEQRTQFWDYWRNKYSILTNTPC